jgi:hypothetical protein
MVVTKRRGSPEPIPGGARCPICGLWFKSQKALNAHMRIHKHESEDNSGNMNMPNINIQTNPASNPAPQSIPMAQPQQSLPMQMVQDPNAIPLPFGVQSPPIPGQQQQPNWLMNLITYVGQKLIDKYLGGSNDKMQEFLINLAFDSLKWRLGIADAVLNNFAKSILKNPEIIAKYLSGELGEAQTGGGGTS